jgi:hypothetical protein
LRWHPNGKTVVLNSTSYYNQTGMCLFTIGQTEATHVFNLTHPWCMTIWSKDGSQLIACFYCALDKLWLLNIDPKKTPVESLAPALSTEEFFGLLQEKWKQRIAADPSSAENYVSRAVVSMAVGDDASAQLDMDQCVELITEPNDPAIHAINYWENMCFSCTRFTELELWALPRARLMERFAGRYPALGPDLRDDFGIDQHPYSHLIQACAVQGDKQGMRKWQQAYRLVQETPLTLGRMTYDKNADKYMLIGSGMDIGGTCDDFHFAYKQLEGDGHIIAKITRIDRAHEGSKVGVMIRNGLDLGVCNAALVVTSSGKVNFQYRKANFQDTVSQYLNTENIELPYWIKLERKGSLFTVQHSADGLQWTDVVGQNPFTPNSVAIDMNERVYIGLAVTSHSQSHIPTHAEVSNVRVTGTVTPAGPFIVSKDIGYLTEPNPAQKDRGGPQ